MATIDHLDLEDLTDVELGLAALLVLTDERLAHWRKATLMTATEAVDFALDARTAIVRMQRIAVRR